MENVGPLGGLFLSSNHGYFGGEGRGVGLPESPPSGIKTFDISLPTVLSTDWSKNGITSSPLPTLQGISLHSPSGLLEASVSHVSQLGSLSVEGLELFECFHRYTVDTVLGPHPHLHWQGQAALVLPLLNSSPDLDLCRHPVPSLEVEGHLLELLRIPDTESASLSEWLMCWTLLAWQNYIMLRWTSWCSLWNLSPVTECKEALTQILTDPLNRLNIWK